jgi:hypothetical protein
MAATEPPPTDHALVISQWDILYTNIGHHLAVFALKPKLAACASLMQQMEVGSRGLGFAHICASGLGARNAGSASVMRAGWASERNASPGCTGRYLLFNGDCDLGNARSRRGKHKCRRQGSSVQPDR